MISAWFLLAASIAAFLIGIGIRNKFVHYYLLVVKTSTDDKLKNLEVQLGDVTMVMSGEIEEGLYELNLTAGSLVQIAIKEGSEDK